MQGRVKLWTDKGYGFISPEGGGGDIFFHASETRREDDLLTNDAVVFELGEDRRGRPCAVSVRPA